MSDHAATVGAIYEAFGRGDVSGILDRISDAVRWEHWSDHTAQKGGVPWLLPRAGKAGVAEFLAVVGQMQFHEFRVGAIMVGGDKAASEVAVDATLPSGRRFQDEEIHLWTFDAEGKVVGFRHYVDTAKHIAAAEGFSAA